MVTQVQSREQAEEELQRFAIFVRQANEAIIITDPEGNIQFVNEAFSRITGYTIEEAMGQNPRILKSGVHDASHYKRMWDTLLSGKVWKGHIINRRKDGGIVEEDATISPLYDDSGVLVNFVAIKRDVTDQIMLERQVRQAQKMEAIGVLAGGIAHDFNNILSAIIGYTEMAMDEIEDGPAKQDLNEVLKGGHRAKDLVRQILTFSRQSEHELRPTEPHTILMDSIMLLRASLPSTVEIIEKIEEDAGSIMGDPTQISQILMNLGANAAHAMPEKGGQLKFSLHRIRIEEELNTPSATIKPGDYIKISVADNGHGMVKEVIERIFEPFFTTKEVGKGTGLGLSAVHGIVMSHGGAITVDSEPGSGTEFTLYFPRISTRFVKAEGEDESSFSGAERILHVDDEEAIVTVVQRGLSKLGYKVTGKSSAKEALAMFTEEPSRFDLAVVDLTMPEMTGDEVIREIRKLRPTLPVILTTGYSQGFPHKQALEMKINRQVTKPLAVKDLAKSIRAALKEAASQQATSH
jgi:PAS domain S-box-containing protein